MVTLLFACSLIVPSTQADDPKKPEPLPVTRAVQGQILTSPSKPALKLEFDKAFKYVGGHSFILYDVANAEQHFFVDADAKGTVKRLYWIQFEGYLPSNTHTYKYKANKTARLGHLEFIADASARSVKDGTGRPNSDGQRALAFLKSKGLRMASEQWLSQRLVHLLDDTKRDELMIIYLEDLSPMNLTAADLAPQGKAFSQWNEISSKLLERSLQGMKLVP